LLRHLVLSFCPPSFCTPNYCSPSLCNPSRKAPGFGRTSSVGPSVIKASWLIQSLVAARRRPINSRVLEKVVSKAAFAREANSFGRNSITKYRGSGPISQGRAGSASADLLYRRFARRHKYSIASDLPDLQRFVNL